MGHLIRKLLQRFARKRPRWPKAQVSLEFEPKFLFALTPPYSGSTALAKILNTAPNSMILQKRAEGQWLVPGMCEPDRWQPDKLIDWESVRSTWLAKFELVRYHVETTNLIIEKSPPNLVRVAQLREHFPNSCFFAFNRNPYANCSSLLHRVVSERRRTSERRQEILGGLANDWLFRSRFLRDTIRDLGIPHFTYERFCEDAAECVARLIAVCPELAGVNVHASILVKDYREQGLVDQNPKNIAQLTPEDIATISAALRTGEDLVQFFNYEIL